MSSEIRPQFSPLSIPELRDFAPAEQDLLKPGQPKTKSRHAITIARSPEEVIKLVTESRDIIYALAGAEMRLEEAEPWIFDLKIEIGEDSITFQSSEDLDVKVKGEVRFAQASDGKSTVLTVQSDYILPGGKLQEWLNTFAGNDPDTVILVQMKRLKALLETGEIPTTKGQPSGRDQETKHTVH